MLADCLNNTREDGNGSQCNQGQQLTESLYLCCIVLTKTFQQTHKIGGDGKPKP